MVRIPLDGVIRRVLANRCTSTWQPTVLRAMVPKSGYWFSEKIMLNNSEMSIQPKSISQWRREETMQALARCCRPAARRRLTAGLMALALAAATALPARAGGAGPAPSPAQAAGAATAAPLLAKPAGGWRDELNPYAQSSAATVKAGVDPVWQQARTAGSRIGHRSSGPVPITEPSPSSR